jgi:hypothetical protein
MFLTFDRNGLVMPADLRRDDRRNRALDRTPRNRGVSQAAFGNVRRDAPASQ